MAESIIIKMDQKIVLDEDAEMVRSAQINPTAFKHLYQKWLNPIYRYFYFKVGNVKDAEDLSSQVFLKAFESLPRYKDQGNFSAWLFSIAHTKAVDYYRKPSKDISIDQITEMDQLTDPLIQAIENDEVRRILNLLKYCSEEEQEMIRLRYMAELNYRQIGIIMNRSEEAVRKQISRLIDRLQAQLEVNND